MLLPFNYVIFFFLLQIIFLIELFGEKNIIISITQHLLRILNKKKQKKIVKIK